MFTAYGAGGIAGPYLAASLMRVVDKVTYKPKARPGRSWKIFTVGDYRLAFIAAGIACLVAALLVTPHPPVQGK